MQGLAAQVDIIDPQPAQFTVGQAGIGERSDDGTLT
jgi:hypothetical protein